MTNVQSIIQELTKNDVCYFFELSRQNLSTILCLMGDANLIS